jgi:hypothetical protein
MNITGPAISRQPVEIGLSISGVIDVLGSTGQVSSRSTDSPRGEAGVQLIAWSDRRMAADAGADRAALPLLVAGVPTLTDTSTAMGDVVISDSGFPAGRIDVRLEDRVHAGAQRRDGFLGEPRVAGLPAEVQW